MDKSWLKINDRADPTYIGVINSFIEWSFNQPRVPMTMCLV